MSTRKTALVSPREALTTEAACRLRPQDLRWTPAPASLPSLESAGPGTAAGVQNIFGQERALASLRFGLGMRDPGFNIYVAGPSGIGKMTAIRAFLDDLSSAQPTPPDWCYVHNFQDPYQPKALSLPPGQGRRLAKDMDQLLEQLSREVPKAFESEAYGAKREKIVSQLQKERTRILAELNDKAAKEDFAFEASPIGILITPLRKGQPIPSEDFEKMPAAEKESLQAKKDELDRDIKTSFQKIREAQNRTRRRLEEEDRSLLMFVVGGLFQEMTERYKGSEKVTRYLEAVQVDLLENIDALKRGLGVSEEKEEGVLAAALGPHETWLRKYKVNVLVDNAAQKGAPVVVDWDAAPGSLVGRIEKEGGFGALHTDFTLLKSGALHQANGGYLVLQVEDLLRTPFAWDSLKRALRRREIQIEDPVERLGFFATKSLRPEPIPLGIKVILVGRPQLYYLLHAYDEDFPELFRVRADFDTRLARDERGVREILSFLKTLAAKEGLLPLEPDGKAKLLEHAARLAESQTHLSTHFGALVEVVREAQHWAVQEKARGIGARQIRRAVNEKIHRSSLIEGHVRDMVRQGTLLIQTSGKAVGQVNGLAVIELGDYAFGKPSRITASVGPGREGIVDIEREVELSGPIHSKGVLILNGYLVHRYAQTRPLSLTARLVFEQSYSGVEGDSASSAELYALLSELSGLPLDQGIAVTGSVNQRGEIQAIGATNEKIEGFYDICRIKGLTGRQGVIIPDSNRDDLMLREDVVDAVRAGRFHVWAVRSVDEGMEILTGARAGRRGPDGSFPRDSVNRLVERRLQSFSASLTQEVHEGLARPGRSRAIPPPARD